MRHTLHQNASRIFRLVLCGLLAAGELGAPRALAAATMQAGPTITGRVIDARTNQGIPGVSVVLDNGRLGAQTGEDGRFRLLNVSTGTHVVAVRRIGYASARQSIVVAAESPPALQFTLQPAAASLDEVVITGTAGGEQRRAIGNVVTTINATEEISKSSSQNLSSLIGARAPGVIIAPSTGRVGSGPNIQIRGRNSIGLNTSPLLYIDGVRVNNAIGSGPVGAPGRLGGQGSNVGGRLNDINPQDIESIEIIKGPAAATIYGTEAANGVIQIITKRGAAGVKPVVNLQVQDGTIWFRDAAGRIPTNYYRDPKNATAPITTWNGVESEAALGTPLFRTGQTRLYSASLSGGRDVVTYYAAGNYQNDLGIEPNNSFRQFGFHANLNVAPSPVIDVATSLNFVTQSAHLGADFGASAMLGAIVGHGSFFTATRGFFAVPPEVPQTLYDNAQGINRFTGSVTMNHRPLSWFSQRLAIGLDQTSDDSRAIEHFAPPALAPFIAVPAGSIGQTLRRASIASADYAGTAKFALTSALSSSTSLGGQFYRTELNTDFLGGSAFPGPGVETVSSVASPAPATQNDTLNTTIGAYAQEQLGWHDRLFVTAAVRIDNNSSFGEQFKWITYPKFSASWVVNEEPFWRANSVVTSMKLRGAYGESGRAPTAFSALRTFAPAQGPLSSSAVTPGSIGNANLRPERGKELELGFESSLFNRLGLDFTYWTKKTTDVIVSQPVAPSSGFAGNQLTNLGRVDNHGIELQANLAAITRNEFTWEITGNLATNKDVIKDLGGLPSNIVNAGQFNQVGGPIGGIYTRRVVSATADANGVLTNVLCDPGTGGDGVPCATAPFLFIGTPTPKTTGAVGNTIYLYKRLRLYALVDFKRGYRVQNSNEELRCFGSVGVPLCRSNYYPQEYSAVYLAEHRGTAQAAGTLDQFYQDASFAKLREVSATYTIPEQWLRGFSRASITLAGRELHTWTNYAGLDPESNSAAIATATTSLTGDQGVTPPLSRFIATINLTF